VHSTALAAEKLIHSQSALASAITLRFPAARSAPPAAGAAKRDLPPLRVVASRP